MKRITSLLLCAALLLPNAAYALDIDFAIEPSADIGKETVMSADMTAAGVLPSSVSGYDGKSAEVDPRYPGVYYTFDTPINTDTLTAANIGNAAVKFFDYDERTNTVILFSDASNAAPGKTVSFGAWNSAVETVNGEAVSFPAASISFASHLNTGDNLTPYGDGHSAYPGIYADDGYTVTSGDGLIHADTTEALSYKAFMLAPIPFEDGGTYKVSFELRITSMGARTTAFLNPSWLFKGSGSVAAQTDGKNHIAKSLSLAASDTFTPYSSEITVDTVTDRSESMAFRVYTNPIKSRNVVVTAPSYEIKNLSVYKRNDITYHAGDCTLKADASVPAMTVGVYLDGSAETTTAKIFDGEMPFIPSDDRWYIDTEKPWKDEDGNLYAAGQEIDFAVLRKSLVLTPNLKTDAEIYTLSFDHTGLSAYPSDMAVFEGDSIDLADYDTARSAAEGKHFLGWSTSGKKEDIVTTVTPTGDVTLYPVIGYDYDFAYEDAYTGFAVSGGTVQKKYMGNMLSVTGGTNAAVTLGNFILPSSKVSAVRVLYDAYSTADAEKLFTPANVESFKGLYINTGLSVNADGKIKRLYGTDICKASYVKEGGKTYLALTFDVTLSEDWNGLLRFMRLDTFDGKADFAVRRIEFDLLDAFEEKTIRFTDVPAPEAGAPAFTSLTDSSGISETKRVVWAPALLPGNVFDSATAYTAEVTLMPLTGSGRYFADDTAVEVNGETVAAVMNTDGTVTFSLSFPMTDNVEKCTVTFDGTGLVASSVPQNITAFKGKEFYASAYNTATSSDRSKRFNGWSQKPNDTDTMGAIDKIPLDGDITLYPIINYDVNFACTANQSGWAPTSCTAAYDGTCMIVTQTGASTDIWVTKSDFSLPTNLFTGIRVYFDPERMNPSRDAIYYCRAGEGADGTRALLAGMPVTDEKTGLITVDYLASTTSNWEGTVTALRHDVFQGTGSSAVRAYVFIYPETLGTDTFTVSGITTPTAGMPDTSAASLHETDNTGCTALRVEWTPALRDGRFEANTAYTAKVYIAPPKDYRFDPEKELTMCFGDQKSVMTVHDDLSASAAFTFDETDDYVPFTLSVSGEDSFYIDGSTHVYTVSFDGKVPDKAVIWSVDNPSLFEIDGKGNLRVKSNARGSVTVKATSAYDPSVSASMTVETQLYDFSASIDGADTISKAARITPYKLIIDSDNIIWDKTAKWSVDDTSVASIDEDTGKLVPLRDGTVVITAVSNYDPSVTAAKTVHITNQGEVYRIHYNPGTTDTVTNMPADEEGQGTVALSAVIPERDGYIFLGWATDDENFDVVSSVALTGDMDVYAVWSKGFIMSYGVNGNRAITSGTPFEKYPQAKTPGSTGYALLDDAVEGENYMEGKTTSVGYYRIAERDLSLDAKAYSTIIIRASEQMQTGMTVYYKSKFTDAAGNKITRGYDTDSYFYVSQQVCTADCVSLGLDDFRNTVFNMTGGNSPSEGRWSNADEIVALYMDVCNVPDSTFRLQYIAVIDSVRTLRFDANTDDIVTGMPDEKTVQQGDSVTVKETPKRTGYTFVGWSKEKDDRSDVRKTFGIVDNLTLYAVWDKAFDGETVQEDGMNVLPLGTFETGDNADALLVLTSAKKGVKVTLTYTDEDGKPAKLIENTNAIGYVVFDLTDIAKLTDAALSVKDDTAIRSASVSDLALAVQTANTVTESKKEKGSSMNDPAYLEAYINTYGSIGDMTVKDVPSENDVYDPDAENADEEEETAYVPFKNIHLGAFPFKDVKTTDWFYGNVASSFAMGLVEGMTETTYVPMGNVTLAEAITLAVRLNDAYYGNINFYGSFDDEWYVPYVNAAVKRGIIEADAYDDYNVPAKRKEVAMMFRRAVPDEWLNQINRFTSVPDLPRTDDTFTSVVKLYNAGIVQGADALYDFCPETNITRAEAAAILCRIAHPNDRLRIVTEEEIRANTKTYDVNKIVAGAMTVGCTSAKLTAKDGGAYAEASGNDPIVYLTNVTDGINGVKAHRIHIGLKWDTEAVKNPCAVGCRIFFTTEELGWSVTRRVEGTWNGRTDENGYADIVFDVTKHSEFNAPVTGWRFDPFDAKASFSIGYIIIE